VGARMNIIHRSPYVSCAHLKASSAASAEVSETVSCRNEHPPDLCVCVHEYHSIIHLIVSFISWYYSSHFCCGCRATWQGWLYWSEVDLISWNRNMPKRRQGFFCDPSLRENSILSRSAVTPVFPVWVYAFLSEWVHVCGDHILMPSTTPGSSVCADGMLAPYVCTRPYV